MGYISENPDSKGAPDPYWIINEGALIVSEDKIYKENEEKKVKEIPISDVSESSRHVEWIKHHENRISKNAEIINIFVTNSRKIDESAKIYADSIFYLHRDNLVEWAIQATRALSTAFDSFVEEGNQEWRDIVHKQFQLSQVTPLHYLELIKKQELKNL